MKIGYPCINRSLPCRSSKTFRLKSYSESRFIETVKENLLCLRHILEYNRDHNILFFRISSDIIPFASHPVLSVDWLDHFSQDLQEIGSFIRNNEMRISMHPDQFIVLNSLKGDVVKRSIDELMYHASLLDGLGLDQTAKIQIHVGGVYNDKQKSMKRFISNFIDLSKDIKKRLVIENDDRSYRLKDCQYISQQIDIPVLFDVFHHHLNNTGESVIQAVDFIAKTWHKHDGIPMIDYSSQEPNEKRGKHCTHIDTNDFKAFLNQLGSRNVDIMFEIKDKEKSVLKAIDFLKNNNQFIMINQS